MDTGRNEDLNKATNDYGRAAAAPGVMDDSLYRSLVDDEAGVSGDNHTDDAHSSDEDEGSLKDFINDEDSLSDASTEAEPSPPPRKKQKKLLLRRKRVIIDSSSSEDEDDSKKTAQRSSNTPTKKIITTSAKEQPNPYRKMDKTASESAKKERGSDRPVDDEILFGSNVTQCKDCNAKVKANYYVKTDGMQTYFCIRRVCTRCKMQTSL